MSFRRAFRSGDDATPQLVPLLALALLAAGTATERLLAVDVRHSDRELEGEVVLCEFVNGPLFTSYKFPEPIAPSRVLAEYRNGLLRVTAPLANAATKVKIEAA